MHGAIGYTQEFDLSLWITKVRALVGAWGTPAYHRARLLEALVRLMEFALTEEQQELAATVRSLLDKRADARVETYDEALWCTLCEQIGVAALGIPEEYDGAGFSLFESLVVLEEVGRSLAPSPLLSLAGHLRGAARRRRRGREGAAAAPDRGGRGRRVRRRRRPSTCSTATWPRSLVVATDDGLFEVDPSAERDLDPDDGPDDPARDRRTGGTTDPRSATAPPPATGPGRSAPSAAPRSPPGSPRAPST